MPIQKTTHRVTFDEPVAPYNSGQQFTTWHRRRFRGSSEASWFPEDKNGNVFTEQGFKVVTKVAGDHEMERKFQAMRKGEGAGIDSPLFENRTPEAAAQQLATVLAWMAECELATLARYERLKSSSKSETERHQKICNRLVRHCAELGVQPNGLRGKGCPRLKECLDKSEEGDDIGSLVT